MSAGGRHGWEERSRCMRSHTGPPSLCFDRLPFKQLVDNSPSRLPFPGNLVCELTAGWVGTSLPGNYTYAAQRSPRSPIPGLLRTCNPFSFPRCRIPRCTRMNTLGVKLELQWSNVWKATCRICASNCLLQMWTSTIHHTDENLPWSTLQSFVLLVLGKCTYPLWRFG